MNRQLYVSARAAGRICTLCLFSWLSCPAFVQATTYYVKPGGSDSNTGLSWAQAYLTLQKAIETAVAGDEIWVAAGTYYPSKEPDGTTDSPRDFTFFINKDIKIYGGFAGTETTLSQRNWTANVTTLSGDIGTLGNNTDNCYHVVLMKYLSNTAVLDGFTVTGGNADGNFPQNVGGGIYNDGVLGSSNPSIANCSFSGNLAYVGGAVYNNGNVGSCSPGFTNCIFWGNWAALGGAVYNNGASGASSPSFTNCNFSFNSADFGGAVFNDGVLGVSNPSFTNCSFSGNSAAAAGGAVSNFGNSGTSSPSFTNCILWGNSSEIHNHNATPSVSYSIVQDGYTPCTSCPGGDGNVNPLFVYAATGDLHLQAGSPAIDAGTSSGAPANDLDGNIRPAGAGIDLGAYEFGACPATGTTWFVNAAAAPGGNGASWACAFQNLQDAIDAASAGDEIWVAAGTYKPTKDITPDPRTKTFFISKNIKIYGGFAGMETMLSQRNWTANVTTLSGDIGTPNDYTDNCYHVLYMQHLSNMAVLDGFTITGGNANGAFPNFGGGGIINDGSLSSSNPSIANCNFVSNQTFFYGGAVYNWSAGGNSSPSFTNCSFSGNFSGFFGGAVFNDGDTGNSSPSFTNCRFTGNFANTAGGAVYNNGFAGISSPTFTNCSFSGNFALFNGGAVYNEGDAGTSNPAFTNCILWGNSSEIHDNSATSTVSYSIIRNGYSPCMNCPGGNGNVDPLFVSQPPFSSAPTTSGDLHLQACSPAIDAGTSSGAPVNDLDGNSRPVNAGIDLGAYEFQGSVPLPTASCKNATIDVDAMGDATLTAGDVDNGSMAPCGLQGLSVAPSAFDCSHVGTPQSVTLTITDVNNNTATCSATVTVQDNTLPTATCKNHTVSLDANGQATITAANVDNGSNDNCSVSLSVSPNQLDCGDIGPNTVTLTATDPSGNTATCSATVTVQDNTLPTATCKNHTVSLDANGQATITAANVDNGSNDNCSVSLSVSPNQFDCGDIGPNTVTLTATDPSGNTATCSATVNVVDNTPPTATCKNHTVSLNGSGNATIAPADVYQSGSDNCGTVNLQSVSPSSFNCTNVGANTVSLTVTDVNNNTATCSATVTVEDNTPPTAACLNPTIALDANGQASISTADVFDAANSSDNCGNPYPVFVTPNAFTCADIGANTVTLQIIDLHGNTALCNATVTVVDNIAPTVTCKNTSVTLNSQGQASLQPIEVYDSGNDNCGNVNLQSVSPNSFDCSNVGTNTVTLTVNDGNGNTATCTASVSVNDNMAPTAKCKNHSVALDANGQASITAADVNDGSSDNCGITGSSVSPSSFGCADVGANTVTLTVSDAQGNSATCTATVTVEDNTPPTALCQNFTTDLDPDGTYTLAPSSIDNGSSDNCSVSLSVSPGQFDCGEIGDNTVTLTATDPSGNTATCSATLTINPFVVINSVSTTDETCQGYSDGTITINATTLGGTLMYSINGGGSYQGLNTFTSVSPGTYSIVVLAQGTSGCSASANASVGSGPAPSTWYKDLDGDGYTDGITHVSCSPPAGYVGSAQPGDCNDNDATINPGATEACNGLDDNCDGIIPADEQDNDADGYRLCDGDCNDSNPAINPGAAEICNGIDDNCNGQIDEGNPPANQVHVGNVNLTSQVAVDNFSNCYYKIQGNLTISGTTINSLANLYNLQEVTGNVLIQVTSLPNMNGLDGLTTIGGSLTIKLNNYGAKLTSLSGLGNLTSIGQNLNISFNYSLSDCCSIDDLLSNAGVGGSISIHHNATGCNSVSDISNSCGGSSIIVIPGNGIALGEEWEQPRMSLFPNPATTEVTVLLEGLGDKTGTLVISDLLGRTMLQRRLEPGQEVLELDLEGQVFGHGIYLVVLQTDEVQLVQRLVIKR